jgi:hypothetical protein
VNSIQNKLDSNSIEVIRMQIDTKCIGNLLVIIMLKEKPLKGDKFEKTPLYLGINVNIF